MSTAGPLAIGSASTGARDLGAESGHCASIELKGGGPGGSGSAGELHEGLGHEAPVESTAGGILDDGEVALAGRCVEEVARTVETRIEHSDETAGRCRSSQSTARPAQPAVGGPTRGVYPARVRRASC